MARRVTLFVGGALTLLMLLVGCPEPSPPKAPPAPAAPADAGPPKLDVGAVLGILTSATPSLESSVRADGDGVAIDLHGSGPPTIALELLASLPVRLAGVRVTKISLGPESAWSAALTTATSNAPLLADVVAASRAVFPGLLARGDVAANGARLSFTGVLSPGRDLADAAGAVPAGYTLARVDAGPPFVLELARAAP